MKRSLGRRLGWPALGLALAFLPASVGAAARGQTARAQLGDLILTLSAHATGTTITANARLTNTGGQAWTYYGGCAPPVLQIQARNGANQRVYGWKASRINCHALALLHLEPGASIHKQAMFDTQETVYVRALVPLRSAVPGTSQPAVQQKLETREIKVVAPAL